MQVDSQRSLQDLEQKFQKECDDLLVSISAQWQTIPEMESAKFEDSTVGGPDEGMDTIY